MKIKEIAKTLNQIVAVGDIHGAFNGLGYNIKMYNLTNSVIVLCGDVGVGFYKHNFYVQIFRKLNTILKKNNCVLFCVRGNHDNPEYFDGSFFGSNYMLVPDYTIIETIDKTLLFIGGAVSIDRIDRINDKRKITYWEDEIPVYDEDKLNAINKVDYIFTHSCPNFTYPTTKYNISDWLERDVGLNSDIDKEREVFTKVWENLKNRGISPIGWFYGHYHQSHFEYIDKTLFKLCDIMEFFDIRN